MNKPEPPKSTTVSFAKGCAGYGLTWAEIYKVVRRCHSLEHGNFRIYQAYQDGRFDKEFFRLEHGVGGQTVYFLDGGRGFVSYDNSGITIYHNGTHQERELSWKEAYEIAMTQLKEGYFLTKDELKEFNEWKSGLLEYGPGYERRNDDDEP